MEPIRLFYCSTNSCVIMSRIMSVMVARTLTVHSVAGRQCCGAARSILTCVRPVNKVVGSMEEAVSVIKDGATVYVCVGQAHAARAFVFTSLVGGFGLCSIPEKLIAALQKQVSLCWGACLRVLSVIAARPASDRAGNVRPHVRVE